MSDERVFKHELDLAVRGQYVNTESSIEDLLWLAGEHRRQIEAAHHALDMREVPRKQGEDGLTLAGRIDQLPRPDTETAIHGIRESIEREIRDTLVAQTRSLVTMADTLSDSLGHSIALLAALDERAIAELPRFARVVTAGRQAVQAWQEAKPHINDGLAALDD